MNHIQQRMAHKADPYPFPFIERDFKGEDHCHPIHPPGNLLNPPPPPSPYLRTDIIEHGYL
jgi:hypothetical protein